MKKKSLFDSNPHLRDAKKYREALIASVSSSTAIETGASVETVSQQLNDVTGSQTPPATPDSTSR